MNIGSPRLSLARIIEMNIGFFGLQFSFGLQQANMGPIYAYLGADEANMPLLWLAGPMTGLIVQPLIGALSDRTRTRFGRRTPYFLIGALLCSISLFLMPYSPTLWMAASLLWLLDAGNNITMEPYRAYVADRLAPDQRSAGFLTQSAFTGLAQTLSYLAPSLLALVIDGSLLDANGIPAIVRIAFVIGAILSISTILWSVVRVPERPDAEQEGADAKTLSLGGALADLRDAVIGMPKPMRQLALAMFCQWYAMFVYWQYIAFALSRSIHGTSDATSEGFRQAALTAQQLGAFYNFIAFIGALALIPIVRRLGARPVHAACLTASGLAMLALPHLAAGNAAMPYIAMIGIGIGWAGMMGNTYVMLSGMIPSEKNGIYMGIFNMFIVIPMLLETLTLPLLYGPLLGNDPRRAIALAGLLMLAGAGATLRVGAAKAARRLPAGTQ